MEDAVRTNLICQGCKKEREKRDEKLRLLYRMPSEVTTDKGFRNPAIPLYLCQHCDGDAIEDTMREHHKRIGRS